MPEVTFFIVDSFTRTPFAGNPAGVILTDAPLTEPMMLAIAGELHLESAFATPATVPEVDYQVAYYTGTSRIPLCGHDTVALVTVLARQGRCQVPGTVRLSTDVGVLAVSIAADGMVTINMALPQYGPMLGAGDVAQALGLPPAEIEDTGLPVRVVSTGTPFVIVPVVHRAALSALAPDMAALIAYGDGLADPIAGFYLWSPETEGTDALVHARCFCPAVGLPEDPVTGTGSGAVGAYLARHGGLEFSAGNEGVFRTEQGYAMGRPGNALVRIKTESGVVTQVQVSGPATVTGQGTLRF
jgi:trans-2,3-dihydro-3-hydroxyanthranilate isomerase